MLCLVYIYFPRRWDNWLFSQIRYLLHNVITYIDALDSVNKLYIDFLGYIIALSFSARTRGEGIVICSTFVFEYIVIELVKGVFIESVSSI